MSFRKQVEFSGGLISSSGSNTLGSIITTTNGNVGIGTTAPTSALDIAGSIKASAADFTGMTIGNINITGQLFQNGGEYASSQWQNGSSGSISYTSGGVVVTDLNVTGGFSGGNISLGNVTVANLLSNNVNFGVANTFSGSFIGANDVTNSNVTGLAFASDIVSFKAELSGSVLVSSGANYFETFTLEGVQANSGWTLAVTRTGDISGISFSIDSSTGQVMYTSPSFANWTSTTFRYIVTQTSKTGTYATLVSPTVGNYNFSSLQINDTTDALLGLSNGALNVLGGATVAKNLNVGGGMTVANLNVTGNFTGANILLGNVTAANLVTNNVNFGVANTFSGSFAASNNVTSGSSVTDLSFSNNDIVSFTAQVSISVLVSSGTSLFETVTLEGIQGSSGWSMGISRAGDNSGIGFSINASGQVNYTSTNIANWSSTTFRYIVTRTTKNGTYTSLLNPTVGNYSFGTLQVNDTTNAVAGVSNGGLNVLGGATIAKNLNVNSVSVTGGSLNATFNSNTIGNLFTTGGNIGIGISGPSGRLHIKQFADDDAGNLGNYNQAAITMERAATANKWSLAVNSGEALVFAYNLTEIGYLFSNVLVNNIDFTGQHRCASETILPASANELVGYIVSSTGDIRNLSENSLKPTINEALPVVSLSSVQKDKAVYGVISESEDDSTKRTYATGSFVTVLEKQSDDIRLIINSVGEGAIWVCNINGNIENGDYITSSSVPGIGMKQDDDLLRNYTVAKASTPVDFNDTELETKFDVKYVQSDGTILTKEQYESLLIQGESVYLMALAGCTYHCG